MRKSFFRWFKFLTKAFLFFILAVVLYIACMYGIAYIPVNSDTPVCKEDCVEVYLRSNGVHTDVVMPVKDSLKDWTENINPALTKSGRTNFRYIAIGWGDKGFYLDAPTWGDLTFKTAFNALFYLSSSAMHVTFYDDIKEGERCKKIYLRKADYEKIISYIESSFDKNDKGDYMYIKNASYGNKDLFLEAKGRYSFLYTCNTWTNNCLKAGNQKACLWTLFDTGIFYHYK
jgi:uncharacterized protein (TIGR02117 family)